MSILMNSRKILLLAGIPPRIFDRINAPGLSPPGKQNGIFPGNLYLIYRSVMNAHLNLQKLLAN
jgi:hypothetical protein